MMEQYRKLAFAIVNQAIQDYFYFRKKNVGKYYRYYRNLKDNPPLPGEAYIQWLDNLQKARHRFYRVKDAEKELTDIRESMEDGEIARLLELLDFPMTGKEVYLEIANKQKKPRQLRNYVVKVK